MLRDEIKKYVKKCRLIEDSIDDSTDNLESLMDDFAVKFSDWKDMRFIRRGINYEERGFTGNTFTLQELLTEFKTKHYKP